MSQKKDFVEEKCQIGLFGDTGIGKTSLIVQFLQNKFNEEHDPTMEDFFNTSRYFGKQDKIKTNMAILDTAGQEDYQSLLPQQMEEAEGFMLVYSVIDKKSFDRVQALQKKIMQTKEKVKVVPVLLVANKIDLKEKRAVTKEEGEALAKQYGCQYIETSAKSRINVDEAFEALAMEVRKFKQVASKTPGGGKKDNCEIQ